VRPGRHRTDEAPTLRGAVPRAVARRLATRSRTAVATDVEALATLGEALTTLGDDTHRGSGSSPARFYVAEVDRETVPDAVRPTTEFAALCAASGDPASASHSAEAFAGSAAAGIARYTPGVAGIPRERDGPQRTSDPGSPRRPTRGSYACRPYVDRPRSAAAPRPDGVGAATLPARDHS